MGAAPVAPRRASETARSWLKLLGVSCIAALGTACTVAAGAGLFGVVVGAGILASSCYDHVDVTVYDAARGARVCDARVFAVDGEHRTEFRSCYHAALGEGSWKLVVERAGYVSQSTELAVEHPRGCPRRVGTVRVDLAPATPAPFSQAPGEAPVGPAPAVPAAAPTDAGAPPPFPARTAHGDAGRWRGFAADRGLPRGGAARGPERRERRGFEPAARLRSELDGRRQFGGPAESAGGRRRRGPVSPLEVASGER